MFKVGDIVECCVANRYAITDVGVKCVVENSTTKSLAHNDKFMDISVLHSGSGTVFTVEKKNFCLSEQELNEEQINDFIKFLEE